ncbi:MULTISPECIES: (d)CMP kinase [unclassified Bosea (in: a-proteobacteria)]|uniref:(d)CMP kinase n=1 Tax=unclassified Bosea (in: a-proteobacteria) TaxID=2653178 RepID=UPI000956EEBF|nr:MULTISPECIES: (d)CMP kinase [unclassified Bosea (in: a-proteobacteria)]TAJ31235.1 MAG: (d)CMP kinase [Bosea sp. (in: a-proteobacteria)]SIQ96336.1 cytidylate kinase [Bosea sp. TND4EK4]
MSGGAARGALVIAVDGPAASGKGTLARRLAAHYGLPCLDTGLLYRMVARAMLDAGHDIDDAQAATGIVASFDQDAFPEERLRGREIGEAASVVAAMPAVRAGLLERQRRFAAQPGGAVLDGRDIGTVICPDATAKLFVTATPEVRAARRYKELTGRGEAVTQDAILADIRRRDARDSGRSDAPLKAAEDAILLDTSALGIDEVLAAAIRIVESRRAA